MAGALVRREAAQRNVEIIPIDSEHSAIFQCLAGSRAVDVERLILTCSGGPFRTWHPEQIAAATVEQALAHPNWSMGDKISIDSATLMNKGLEVIEARWLFDVEAEQVEVVVHPQSIVHSLVEFCDRSVLAQLGLPDMRVPISLNWRVSTSKSRTASAFPVSISRIARCRVAKRRPPCSTLPMKWRWMPS